MSSFLYENHWGGLLLTLLNVLGVLNVLCVLNVLNVLNMPMDASLACWALFFFVLQPRVFQLVTRPSQPAPRPFHLPIRPPHLPLRLFQDPLRTILAREQFWEEEGFDRSVLTGGQFWQGDIYDGRPVLTGGQLRVTLLNATRCEGWITSSRMAFVTWILKFLVLNAKVMGMFTKLESIPWRGCVNRSSNHKHEGHKYQVGYASILFTVFILFLEQQGFSLFLCFKMFRSDSIFKIIYMSHQANSDQYYYDCDNDAASA